MNYEKEKKFAAAFSVLSNTTLIVIKLVAGFISGSISIISEAIHSMSDLLASIMALFSITKSSEPADAEHQFGHGKYEDFSGLVEGALIILASFYIVYEAGVRIISHSGEQIETKLGIVVMAFSVIVNILVSNYLKKIAKKSDSIALYADAEHLRTDVYSSLAILIGLILIKLTDIHILDPIFAIIVAVIILTTGFDICKKSTNNLLDGALPEEENRIINRIFEEREAKENIKFINLKTRKSGMYRQIEFTILLEAHKTINEGHVLCDEIETQIEKELGNTSFLIHLEPFTQNNCIK